MKGKEGNIKLNQYGISQNVSILKCDLGAVFLSSGKPTYDNECPKLIPRAYTHPEERKTICCMRVATWFGSVISPSDVNGTGHMEGARVMLADGTNEEFGTFVSRIYVQTNKYSLLSPVSAVCDQP